MIRRLHPDFHIPEYVTNVASEFDGDAFADSLAEAHIDSVVIFAKCMYGFGYWKHDGRQAPPRARRSGLFRRSHGSMPSPRY